MSWSKGIVKVAVGRIDYGDSFPKTERYEYKIISFNDKGDETILPGTFVCTPSAKKYLNDIHSKIVKANKSPCLKGDMIDLQGYFDPEKESLLESRQTQYWSRQHAKAAQKRYDNEN